MSEKNSLTVRNGYTCFIKHYSDNEHRKGRRISNITAFEEGSKMWERLSQSEREMYAQEATRIKRQKKKDANKNGKDRKLTCTGMTYEEAEHRRREAKNRVKRADHEIKMTVTSLPKDLLKTHLFYLIHCNYYCRTDELVYIPGELAISEFSLESGVRRTYHAMINPGRIPVGLAYEARRNIESVHGLPYPPYKEGDSDYSAILDDILEFIKPGVLPDGTNPPFYTVIRNMEPAEQVLRLFADLGTFEESYFRVYPIYKLFFWLRNQCSDEMDDLRYGFPFLSLAENEVEKDTLCYLPRLSCVYHTPSATKYQNCSLSFVQRYVFFICKYCCPYIGVDMVPGRHCRYPRSGNTPTPEDQDNSDNWSDARKVEVADADAGAKNEQEANSPPSGETSPQEEAVDLKWVGQEEGAASLEYQMEASRRLANAMANSSKASPSVASASHSVALAGPSGASAGPSGASAGPSGASASHSIASASRSIASASGLDFYELEFTRKPEDYRSEDESYSSDDDLLENVLPYKARGFDD